MTTSPDWLRRYRDGYRDQVWQGLRQLGGAVREHGVAGEAQLVCDEMARRARHNIELIVRRLNEQGCPPPLRMSVQGLASVTDGVVVA